MEGGRGLESFKEALKREHLAGIKRLEQERDEKITNLVAEGRMAVQKKVSALRKEQDARFNSLAGEKKKEGWSSARAVFLEEFSRLKERAEGELRQRVTALKSSDRQRYDAAMAALAREALEACGRPAVLFVETGDGGLITEALGGEGFLTDVEVRESNLDGWGGCRAETENEIIDNTLLARWGRMKTVFSLKLSRLMNDSFTEISGRISKL
ncbi:MAG: hypothetical protein GX310_03930 [Synergistaceae bacterium]|nr:hypothetical protein [Synergistaceae bacterium]